MRTAIKLLALAVFLPGCGALITPQKELEIGRGVDAELAKQYRFVHSTDPVAKWAVEFVKPLEAASKKFRDPAELGGYKVKVIADDKLVNAFAAPGGYTYISTGLILRSKSCAEIAGVMGHELAHVTQKHGVKSLEQAMAAQTLTEMLAGEGSLTSQAAVTILGVLQKTTFSQSDETEADAVGLQISANSGYNPYGLAAFFKTLLGAGGGGMPQFLSSHPATKDRIKKVNADIKKRFGDRYKAADVATSKCEKTKLQLPAVQSRIKGGQMKLTAKTVAPKPATQKPAKTK